MSFVTDIFGGGDAPTVAPYQASPITTTFGTVTPSGGGGVTTALSPELQSFYNQYLQAAQAAMPSAAQQQFAGQIGQYGQGMFNQAANLNIPQITQDYYNQQQNLLAPQRAQEETRLANTLFSQGRTGAGIGMGQGYVNPEQYALLQAREQANAGMLLSAEDRARAIQSGQLQQGLGLYGMGQTLQTQPYQTSAGLLGQGINLGQLPASYIPYSLQAGQNVTGVNQMNAQMEAQNQASNLGFWGGLIGSGFKALGSLPSTPTPSQGGYSPPSGFQTSSWWGGK
jgi:hypothetical protein